MKGVNKYPIAHHWFFMSVLFMMGSSITTQAQRPSMARSYELGPNGKLEVKTSREGLPVHMHASGESVRLEFQ